MEVEALWVFWLGLGGNEGEELGFTDCTPEFRIVALSDDGAFAVFS